MRPDWVGRDSATASLSLENLDYPHRSWLARALVESVGNPPTASVLEVGCAYGPNLIQLNRLAPRWRYTGVDISPSYVALGRSELKKLGLHNIVLQRHDLALPLPSEVGAFDVVFSDAVVMYASPRRARRILEEMVRVSHGIVAVLELTGGNRLLPHRPNRDGWLHNYPGLLSQFRGVHSVTSVAMPQGVRAAGRWPQFGRLTIARVSDPRDPRSRVTARPIPRRAGE